MNNQTHQLAQINIAHALDSMESETMKGFVDRLEEINTHADNSSGFVWRLKTEEGDATAIIAFDEPLMIINMSVWEDIESLKDFVYKSMHIDLIKDRDAWFNKISKVHQALWWIPKGHIPSVEEGKEKLKLLQQEGPNDKVFTFAKPYHLTD